jgi:hypothetical protein
MLILVEHLVVVRGRQHRVLVWKPVCGSVIVLAGIEECHGLLLLFEVQA